MPIFDVHCYAVVRVKVPRVEADSQQEAIELALKKVDGQELFPYTPHPFVADGTLTTEFADEFAAFLVDEEGDEEYSRTRWYGPDGKPMTQGPQTISE